MNISLQIFEFLLILLRIHVDMELLSHTLVSDLTSRELSEFCVL